MKKRNKEIIENVALGTISIIFLIFGAFAWEIGQQGKAICLIMSSLYLAMWVHAGMIATLVNLKFEDRQKEMSKSGTVEKAVE